MYQTKDMKVKEIEASISDVIDGAAFKEALKASGEDPENPDLVFIENEGLESFVAKKLPKSVIKEIESDESITK